MKWVVLLVLVVIALTAFALWRRMQALPQSAADPATRPLTPGATGSAEPDGDVSGPDPSGPDSRTPR